VFKRKASEIFEVFHGVYPDMELELNSSAPRRGAFELTVMDSNGDETLLWSGIKKGPPRREKFPDPNSLLTDLKKLLST